MQTPTEVHPCEDMGRRQPSPCPGEEGLGGTSPAHLGLRIQPPALGDSFVVVPRSVHFVTTALGS